MEQQHRALALGGAAQIPLWVGEDVASPRPATPWASGHVRAQRLVSEVQIAHLLPILVWDVPLS